MHVSASRNNVVSVYIVRLIRNLHKSSAWSHSLDGDFNSFHLSLSIFDKLEAQLSPSDRVMRLVSSNLANYHATVQKPTYTTSPDQTDGMRLEV